MEEWISAERVQKNSKGEYRALINGQWQPVSRAQKNKEGLFRVQPIQKEKPSKNELPPYLQDQERSFGENVQMGLILRLSDIYKGVSELFTGRKQPPEKIDWYKPSTSLKESRKQYEKFKSDVKGSGGGIVGGAVADIALSAGPTSLATKLAGPGAGITKTILTQAPTQAAYYGITTPGDLEERAVSAGIAALATAIGVPVARFVSAGAGKVKDIVTGKYYDLKTKKILEDAIGKENIPAAKMALEKAKPGETTAQAIGEKANYELSSLEELARREHPTVFGKMAESQAAKQGSVLSSMARGETQAGAMDARKMFNDAMNARLNPLRTTSLDAANQYGETVRALSGKSQRLGSAASSKVQDAVDLSIAAGRAENLAQNKFTVPGYPRVPGRYTYEQELAALGERKASEAADASLKLGDYSRFLERQMKSLDAYGYKNLNPESIFAKIREVKFGKGEIANDLQRRVLSKLERNMKSIIETRGYLDAYDLHGIRKYGINNAIEDATKGMDKNVKDSIIRNMPSIRAEIDNAIEEAGGKGWTNYLKRFSKSAHELDQLEMTSKMKSLFDKGKYQEFIDIAKGQNTDAVEDVFGKYNYDFTSEMGKRGKALKVLAEQFEKDLILGKRSSRAMESMKNILEKDIFSAKLPRVISRPVVIANTGIEIAEKALKAKATNIAFMAMKDPQKALKLFDTYPAAEQSVILKMFKDNNIVIPTITATTKAGTE